jgi:hypothetical protein
LASPVGSRLLPGLTVLDLTSDVSPGGAGNVLGPGSGLLERPSLSLSHIQTAGHGLAGNVLRRNASLAQGLLRCPHLTGDRPLRGQHVLTANVCKGPCAESRLL